MLSNQKELKILAGVWPEQGVDSNDNQTGKAGEDEREKSGIRNL